jgi:hypothetical protein
MVYLLILIEDRLKSTSTMPPIVSSFIYSSTKTCFRVTLARIRAVSVSRLTIYPQPPITDAKRKERREKRKEKKEKTRTKEKREKLKKEKEEKDAARSHRRDPPKQVREALVRAAEELQRKVRGQ